MHAADSLQHESGSLERANPTLYHMQQCPVAFGIIYTGLLILRGKKAKFRGTFRCKLAEKSADFAGKKSKFTEKSADFAGFSQARSQNSEKSAAFVGFQRKKVKFQKIFRGKFLEKSADFTGNFGGKIRQKTISKKQPISLDCFWQISLKSINFASI